MVKVLKQQPAINITDINTIPWFIQKKFDSNLVLLNPENASIIDYGLYYHKNADESQFPFAYSINRQDPIFDQQTKLTTFTDVIATYNGIGRFAIRVAITNPNNPNC